MTFFLQAADRFSATVEATTDWSAPSPCAGWTAADVVDHVVDTERQFLAGHDVELGDRPGGTPAELWAAHLVAVRPRLTPDLLAREYDGFLGRTTIGATLDHFYGFDLVVHGWDLGSSNGRPTTFTDDELDAVEGAFEAFGDHAYDDGVFTGPIDAPEDASRQARLLARTGRRA
ncbi:maleylpyruvate isomerase N-terminal domain-containing protein [Nocardioides sp.]|uniref:maleylpyruvate isomerase N-terminal domain-containing protein n=1 Tax=Nocardioides sp. TaxID=35761 RepID=UPI003784E753